MPRQSKFYCTDPAVSPCCITVFKLYDCKPQYPINFKLLIDAFAFNCLYAFTFNCLDAFTFNCLDAFTFNHLDAITFNCLDAFTFNCLDDFTFNRLDAINFNCLDAIPNLRCCKTKGCCQHEKGKKRLKKN